MTNKCFTRKLIKMYSQHEAGMQTYTDRHICYTRHTHTTQHDEVGIYTNQPCRHFKHYDLTTQLTKSVRNKGPIRTIITNTAIITNANTPRIHQFFHLPTTNKSSVH